jgi:hypothetical protein
MITYTAYDQAAPQHSSHYEGYQLTANTDLGARRQARQIARQNNFKDLRVQFVRESDGCRGEIVV